jgi:hypothetical protein
MQPLSKVRPDAIVTWGAIDTITSRPKVAVRVAECIAEWADIETMLGLFLGLLLNSDSKAALAMYSSVENRSSQRKMIMAAGESKLDADHFDVLSAVMTASVAPVMRARDKLAHWCWANSDDLPNDLLLSEPSEKMTSHFIAIHRDQHVPAGDFDTSKVFVITEAYLKRLAEQLREAKSNVTELAATVWEVYTPAKRAEYLRQLSNRPLVREALARLREARQKNQATQQPSPPPDPSGEA